MVLSTEDKQKLIDLAFSMVIDVCDMYEKRNDSNVLIGKSNLEKAMWVASKLRDCGFDTRPVGMSWGILKEKTILNHFEKNRKVVIEGNEFRIAYINDSSITLEPE